MLWAICSLVFSHDISKAHFENLTLLLSLMANTTCYNPSQMSLLFPDFASFLDSGGTFFKPQHCRHWIARSSTASSTRHNLRRHFLHHYAYSRSHLSKHHFCICASFRYWENSRRNNYIKYSVLGRLPLKVLRKTIVPSAKTASTSGKRQKSSCGEGGRVIRIRKDSSWLVAPLRNLLPRRQENRAVILPIYSRKYGSCYWRVSVQHTDADTADGASSCATGGIAGY